ncbi:polycystic kidney disease protein 1-like 2 [Perca flavescens]|uniref:polycystic kidney disease protein 1-like 2 n=1 Tax=Perca flavescens TaxID=8167 RepID=UPI00106E295F|nr:polycystic kidney disease protein 1-like 2 [Perca flavescens]
MGWTIVHLLIPMTLSCLSCAEDKTKVPVSCPDFQKAFGGSCYEFVDLQHTFYSAEAWCEQRGGHLAFIPDEETQYFLKRFLDPKKDVWLGVAPSASPNLQYSPIVEGALSWLDGSHITYSNWVSSPQLGAACGHILKDSGFQWEATRDCNQKRHFICQFDSGRSIVCAGRNATLQCGSHQVLMIDVGFYGRENIHYCRTTPSPPSTSTEQQCGWVDVVASLTAHCHGRQVCQIAEVVDSVGDPCPQLGSYLSVDYHCKDGLTLSVSTVAAVFEIITISVKWLLHLPQGNLSCMLSTGDGHVIYLHSPEGLERSEVHRYTYPSTFVVAVECTSRDIYIRAQNIITIEEPITVFGAIRCYARKRSFHATNCKVLYREPFQIQMEVKAGTNVTYRIQSDETLLSNVSVFRGNVPQNITVTPEMMKQLGPGCHQLTLYASNTVTFPEMSAGLQCLASHWGASAQRSLQNRGYTPMTPTTAGPASTSPGAASYTPMTPTTAGPASTSPGTASYTPMTPTTAGPSSTSPGTASYTPMTPTTAVPASTSPGAASYTPMTPTTAGPASTSPGAASYTPMTPTTAGPASTSPGAASYTPMTATTAGPASTSPGTASYTSVTPITPTTAGPASTSPGTASYTSVTPITPTTAGPASTSPGTASYTSVTPITPTTAGPASTSPGTASYTPITPTSAGTASTSPDISDATTTDNTSDTSPPATTNNFDSLKCKHLRCSNNNEVKSVFLPLGDSNSNYNLIITATANNSSFVASTTLTAKVQGFTAASSSSDDLKATVDNSLSQLKEQGLLSGETLREKMLHIMIDTVKETPTNTPGEVQVIARGLAAVVMKGTELSSSAQKNISDALLLAMNNTQSALLAFKQVNRGPSIIQAAHIAVFVNRVTPGSLHTQSIYIPNSSSPRFSLPILLSKMLPSDEPVDVRMLSFNKNPFSWNERGNISGQIGALSLTTKDGSSIPVENLSEDIKILLLSSVGEQVNTSVLKLGNSSTTSIHIPADTTLVLKMVPSNDPLPFKLLLGYMDYPTVTNNVAMTEMPHQGTTQEERYTWLLDPKDLKGKTGMHYLVVRPIVGPGIKSINATLSITSITTACKFWDESKLEWSTFGCRVGVQTTPLVTQCLCNHLTSFGSSFFVTPNLVDPSRTAELFGTFGENPVVVCFVGSLFLAYLLVLVWARRKDIQDTAKVKVTVLEDNDPMDEYCYLLSVNTGHRRGASTSSQVTITLLGAEGNSEPHHLTDPKKCVFERGAVDLFLLTTPFSLGELQGIRLWHNNSGSHPAWYVGNVMVQDLQTEQKWHFLCNSWLAIDMGDCSLDKILPVSTEMDLKSFSNLFFMKTTKDFSDRHLWYSVISRPPSSTFTCVQRVSCCFTLLLCTMLTSLMFYGIPTDPSEQIMELGHFEFTWQQFKIGVQSSLIMFPINILIVTIFRNTRPRETSCCKCKTEKPEALEQTFFSQAASTDMNVNVTLDTVIKDITRIAHSLSKTVKSNIPCIESEVGPGQPVDINAVLSVVEDFIKQNHKASNNAQPKTLSSGNLVQPQLPAEEIQKQSNKAKYLYRQLCHIDKELILLGPSGFPTPHSYSQALQQVQDMKGHLQDQLFTFSCVNPDELTQKKLSPAASTEGGGSLKKRGCCHGGLPWWFVFVGWLLVISSSFVAGFFTMLYGLKFGKGRSVSWLVSMIVSFFQSIFVIQPLKVLCLAVFFALVTKKIDEEDFQNVAFEGNDRNLVCKDQKLVRRERSLYEPPPPADVEKMRRNMIMEQKAFALLKEILTYMGFMWMLLLLVYGQRDPNAFFLKRHIQDSFSRGISDSMSLGDVFTWANTSLLSNLFGVYPGFITDGNSKLVGNARLRQVRVQNNSCQIADHMLQFVPDCQAAYSWEVEDMGSYGPGWSQSAKDNISTSTNRPWTYQTQAELRAHAVWGKLALYRGGGFVMELGPDSQNASSTLEYLFRNKWLDIYTRAIFVEFTVYNANVNLFCIVTLFLETSAVGAFQFTSELHSVRLYQSPDGLYILVMAAEIVYLLFIIYYMFLQGQLMKQQRWAYFRSRWNLLELTIILLSWSAVAVFIMRTLLGNRDMTYYQNHKDKSASFYDTGKADSTLQYLFAFLVLLATFKLWHLLRLNPKMNLMTVALQRAWSDITNYLVIIVIMCLAYSITCNVLYGWQLSSYRTWLDALITIISLQIGIFNYDEVIDCNPVLSGLIIGSCIVFMTFVVLNLFVAVIIIAFKQERIYHKPSDEEEIVDLMLEKICGLFGIRYNGPKDTLGPDVKRGRDVGLNNSRNILNSSTIDANVFQKSGNLVNT